MKNTLADGFAARKEKQEQEKLNELARITTQLSSPEEAKAFVEARGAFQYLMLKIGNDRMERDVHRALEALETFFRDRTK